MKNLCLSGTSIRNQSFTFCYYHETRIVLRNDPLLTGRIKNRLHPFDYFADATLLAEARTEISSLLPMIESELNRIFGQSSTDRTWSDDLKIGVHANPSMNHVHIHLITPDMTSDCMKHRNHYNSFTTDFFVPLDSFPLEENAPIWNVQVRNSHLKQSLRCWRCKKVVENVPKLKCHLKEELIEWEQGYRT